MNIYITKYFSGVFEKNVFLISILRIKEID